MNLYLHNIGELDSEDFISPNDALVSDTGNRYDYVLTNPPFGKKSSITITNEDGELEKEDENQRSGGGSAARQCAF